MSLVPVHGGLDALVDRVVPFNQRKALMSEAAGLPRVVVTDADLSGLYRISDGTLSPLTGPMNQGDYEQVLANRTIVRGGVAYAWTIPVILPVTDAEAAAIAPGGKAALVNSDGDVVGVIEVESKYAWDKAAYVKGVYGTERMDHPGGDIVSRDPRATLIGGPIRTLPQPLNPEFGDAVWSPRITRAVIAERGYEAALAFQTRNPLHRAHEYALVYGAEELTRGGKYTGVFLNPLVGQLKGDDVDAATRMRTYRNLRNLRLLGQGDSDQALWDEVGYDINDVFHLVGLDIKMFYGGPAEAVMHAIYRQNHGFSNIVIGRKHADAPYHDKTAIWGDFDAHAIFDELEGHLAIEPVKVGFAAFYDSLGRVDLMEKHEGEKAFFISGTKVRASLQAGERPDPRIMRPATADVLIQAYKETADEA
ncbi:MAG: sulfate adenylyltransferase [Alphaproteobacteria bacterium]|nr:sulfate adenylyltransferase [Alphaproteobacteria bacterium]